MILSLKQVADGWIGIRNIENEKGSAKWSYAITKNKKVMQPDMEGIAAAEKKFEEVNQKRIAWCEEHCKKDKDGKPVIEKGRYLGLDEKNKELVGLVSEMKVLDDEFNALLKTEVDIGVYMISFSDVPNNISPVDYERISFIILEPK